METTVRQPVKPITRNEWFWIQALLAGSAVETSPVGGVYVVRDSHAEIVYVGFTSKSVRQRMAQHRRRGTAGLGTPDYILHKDWSVERRDGDGVEESRLIQLHQPRFNTRDAGGSWDKRWRLSLEGRLASVINETSWLWK